MKKNNYPKTLKENIRHFLRFLKETKVYEKFLWEYKNNHSRYIIMNKPNSLDNFFYYIRYYKVPLRDYLIDSSIHFYISKYGRDFWYNVDDLWLIYIYKNKLYGKSYTISKDDLLYYLRNVVESATKFDYIYKQNTIKEIENILDSEKVIYKTYYD
jgi:hypothetical protein